ncbi:MAG TPA: hypothetical protein ENN41_07780, partial [Sediminispirochaeta sp.]|nr:hypothetical protein [Sediminispirochaeta sp.]
MKNRDTVLLLSVLTLILLAGCLGAPPRDKPRDEASRSRMAMAAPPEEAPTLPPISYEYRREDLLRALIRLNKVRESTEYFSQYLWGDQRFEDLLASVTWLSDEPFHPGRAVLIAFYDEEGREYQRIKTGWIEFDRSRGGVFLLEHRSTEQHFRCEVRVDAGRVPREIFLKNLRSGEKISKQSFFVDLLEEERSASQETWFDQVRREEYQSSISPIYASLEIVGEETIRVADRWIRAVRMSNRHGDGEG